MSHTETNTPKTVKFDFDLIERLAKDIQILTKKEQLDRNRQQPSEYDNDYGKDRDNSFTRK